MTRWSKTLWWNRRATNAWRRCSSYRQIPAPISKIRDYRTLVTIFVWIRSFPTCTIVNSRCNAITRNFISPILSLMRYLSWLKNTGKIENNVGSSFELPAHYSSPCCRSGLICPSSWLGGVDWWLLPHTKYDTLPTPFIEENDLPPLIPPWERSPKHATVSTSSLTIRKRVGKHSNRPVWPTNANKAVVPRDDHDNITYGRASPSTSPEPGRQKDCYQPDVEPDWCPRTLRQAYHQHHAARRHRIRVRLLQLQVLLY